MGVVMLWNVAAQNMVYLERCETLSFDQNRLPDAQLLKGNVQFRHEDALMYCDSAYFYEKTNSLDAFGHVRMIQGDTIEGVGDVLYYNGNTKIARLHQNVVLTHRNTVLMTDSLHYNRTTSLAYYFTGGTIRDEENTLTSVYGSYNMSNKQAEFSHDVHLQNPSFHMDADTLVYNTATNVAYLVSPTTIVYEDETTILSSDGWYNTSTEQSMLLQRSQIIHQDGKQLTGDTIYYDHKTGIGNVFSHMEMVDTIQKLTLYGNYGIMYEKEKSGFATDSAYMLDWSQNDLTYIHADTLFTEEIPYTDTLGVDTTYRRIRAFFHVRAYSDSYQFVCDSMVYNGQTAIVTMFNEPVCWSNNNQLSADTIFIYLNDSTVDYMYGKGSAFGIKQEGADEYDQLSGKEMFAYIQNGELKKVEVKGNAETIFFPRDNDSTYIGVNKSQSSFVTLFIEENKLHHALFTTETTGVLYPLDQIKPEDVRLVGFFWATQERPTSLDNIFERPERTKRPSQVAVSATDDEEQEPVVPAQKSKKRNKRERNKETINTDK